MKYYKDENNQIYGYENDVPEFGSYTEVETLNEDGKTVIEKVYPNITVKEGLIAITEEEADAFLAELDKPTKEQIKANNEATIKSLTQEATLKIDTIQDAIDLDMAEDGDADKLKKWRKYRVLLSRVDTSVENMELPEKPN